MLRLIIAAVALLAVAGGLAYWAYGPGDDSAEAGVEVVRWGNVTVAVPEGSGVIVAREFEGPELNPPDGGPVLVLFKRESFPESIVLIDAETGEVLQDTIQAADRAAIDRVLATLEVREFDSKTAPWPYSDRPPAVPRERWGNITYAPPDPASGIVVRTVLTDYFDSRGSAPILHISNGRSGMGINAKTGLVNEATMLVAIEDEEAFQRFLSEVEFVAP